MQDLLPTGSAADGTTLPDWLMAHRGKTVFAAKSHPHVKDLAARLAGHAADDGCFAAEGIGLCGQVADRVDRIEALHLFLVPELLRTDTALAIALLLAEHAAEIVVLSRKSMEAISRMDGCQGMMLTAHFPPAFPENRLQRSDAVVAVLDGLETPGNIGTIFRTCDGAGVDAVLYCNRRARTNHPELVKASMGAVLDIPFLDVGDTTACAEWLKARGFGTVLADPHGPPLKEGFHPDWAGTRVAVVVGNERYGLHPDWAHHADHHVSIPMRGRCDSLNAGVAASLLLYRCCDLRETIPTDQNKI